MITACCCRHGAFETPKTVLWTLCIRVYVNTNREFDDCAVINFISPDPSYDRFKLSASLWKMQCGFSPGIIWGWNAVPTSSWQTVEGMIYGPWRTTNGRGRESVPLVKALANDHWFNGSAQTRGANCEGRLLRTVPDVKFHCHRWFIDCMNYCFISRPKRVKLVNSRDAFCGDLFPNIIEAYKTHCWHATVVHHNLHNYTISSFYAKQLCLFESQTQTISRNNTQVWLRFFKDIRR